MSIIKHYTYAAQHFLTIYPSLWKILSSDGFRLCGTFKMLVCGPLASCLRTDAAGEQDGISLLLEHSAYRNNGDFTQPSVSSKMVFLLRVAVTGCIIRSFRSPRRLHDRVAHV